MLQPSGRFPRGRHTELCAGTVAELAGRVHLDTLRGSGTGRGQWQTYRNLTIPRPPSGVLICSKRWPPEVWRPSPGTCVFCPKSFPGPSEGPWRPKTQNQNKDKNAVDTKRAGLFGAGGRPAQISTRSSRGGAGGGRAEIPKLDVRA